MKVLLTLTIQKTLELTDVDIDEDDDEWPPEYMKKRDRIVRQFEKQGWNVDITSEDEE